MAHWAQIDENNIVVRVTVGNNDDPDEGYQWLIDNLGGTWIQSSYNTRGGVHYNPETGEPSDDQSKALRYNAASVGGAYDPDRDAFIPPKNYDSWVLDGDTCLWVAPTPYPEDGEPYEWNEGTQSWDPVSEV